MRKSLLIWCKHVKYCCSIEKRLTENYLKKKKKVAVLTQFCHFNFTLLAKPAGSVLQELKWQPLTCVWELATWVAEAVDIFYKVTAIAQECYIWFKDGFLAVLQD